MDNKCHVLTMVWHLIHFMDTAGATQKLAPLLAADYIVDERDLQGPEDEEGEVEEGTEFA